MLSFENLLHGKQLQKLKEKKKLDYFERPQNHNVK